jgi:hypothetical protein
MKELYPQKKCSVVGTSERREFRQVSGLSGILKKHARVFGVFPRREFRSKSRLSTDLTKNPIRV